MAKTRAGIVLDKVKAIFGAGTPEDIDAAEGPVYGRTPRKPGDVPATRMELAGSYAKLATVKDAKVETRLRSAGYAALLTAGAAWRTAARATDDAIGKAKLWLDKNEPGSAVIDAFGGRDAIGTWGADGTIRMEKFAPVSKAERLRAATETLMSKRDDQLAPGTLSAPTRGFDPMYGRVLDRVKLEREIEDLGPNAPIDAYLALASKQTGAPQEFLEILVGKESSGDAGAKASDTPGSTSTARGLGQFTRPTWAEMHEAFGFDDAHPLGATGEDMQALAFNPALSALATGRYSVKNATIFTERMNRPPTFGEVYIMHFGGDVQGIDLIRAKEAGRGFGKDSFSAKAVADPVNYNVFFHKDGRPKTSAESYNFLAGKYPKKLFRVGQKKAATIQGPDL